MEIQTTTHHFNRFKTAIARHQPGDGSHDAPLMDQEGNITIHYAPFEYMNPQARIVIVGITPGPTQMANALAIARQHIDAGLHDVEILRRAKQGAAFSGDTFRRNLVSQLEHWGIDRYLGIDGAASLFGANAHLVQTTSLLRYPVFVGGKKYEGTPNMLRTPILRKHLMDHFVAEVCSLTDALFFGLGPKVWSVLSHLANEGAIDRSRIFNGMFHGSPENTYRITYLTGDRSAPAPWKTNPAEYDEGRERFRRQAGL